MSERMARAAGLRVCTEAELRAAEAVGCTFGQRGWNREAAMWHVHEADGEYVVCEYLYDRPGRVVEGRERWHVSFLADLERVA